jgi:hypothetical protein
MTSKKPASSKRAAPPRACDYTKTFFKDWERLSRSGRYDLKRLKEAMLLLIANVHHWALNGLTIRSRAIEPTTASVTSVAISY